MERERSSASPSVGPSASVAPAIVPPPAAVAATAPVPSVIRVALVPSVIRVAPVPSVIPTGTHSTIVISDDEDTTVSHSPITISDDEEEEIAPVRRLPAVTPPVALPVHLFPISANQTDPQLESGQVGGAKTQQRIEFEETECRRVFRNALLCKTFTPQDEYADLNTVLYSFREVIRRELVPILAEHPGVKAWIGLTNLYDYKDQGVDKELSIKTAPLYIGSEAGIAPLLLQAEKFIIGRNSSFTVLVSDLTYVRNINITLKVAEWNMNAAHGSAELPLVSSRRLRFS